MWKLRILVLAAVLAPSLCTALSAAEHWPQAAGPRGDWQTEGTPPTRWSVTRNENIRWRTPMPEAGMSNVTVWGAFPDHVAEEDLAGRDDWRDRPVFTIDPDDADFIHRADDVAQALSIISGTVG